MVYNTTSRGLNKVVWDPNFTTPNMYKHMIFILQGTNMGDTKIGGIFLNFMIQKIHIYIFGVDVTHVRSKEPKLLDWE